jgi:hypothetical protein
LLARRSRIERPPMVASPEVGAIRHAGMRIMVVFPAPFGPSRPKTSWFSMVRVRSDIAVISS